MRVAVGPVVGILMSYFLVYENRSLSMRAVDSGSIDGFPFVGPIPGRNGQFLASGFTGHGKYAHYLS